MIILPSDRNRRTQIIIAPFTCLFVDIISWTASCDVTTKCIWHFTGTVQKIHGSRAGFRSKTNVNRYVRKEFVGTLKVDDSRRTEHVKLQVRPTRQNSSKRDCANVDTTVPQHRATENCNPQIEDIVYLDLARASKCASQGALPMMKSAATIPS